MFLVRIGKDAPKLIGSITQSAEHLRLAPADKGLWNILRLVTTTAGTENIQLTEMGHTDTMTTHTMLRQCRRGLTYYHPRTSFFVLIGIEA